MGYVEFDYTVMVYAIQNIWKEVRHRKNKKADPRVYWLAGDHMHLFLDKIDSLGFYLVDQYETLGKSIGFSETSVRRIIAFRRRFPDIVRVDPAVPWAEYRENKVPY